MYKQSFWAQESTITFLKQENSQNNNIVAFSGTFWQ